MKVGGWIPVSLLVFACVCGGRAQNLVSAGANAALGAQAIASVSERILQEIRDPHTGTRWVILRSAQNSGGPGRAVAIADGVAKADRRAAEIVIRTGDSVVVEEHTAAVDGTLEAVALGAAASGFRFDARLKIGGRIVRAVALAPGRAALAISGEVQP